MISELNTDNTRLRSYMWGTDLSGTLRNAGGVGALLAINDAAQGSHCPAYDGSGNVAALIKATDGTIGANYEYATFGDTLRLSGSAARSNPLRFSTKFADDESFFVYYGFRYDDPSSGRWLSRDPIAQRGGLNLYTINRNDTINSIDPFGLVDNAVNGPTAAILSWVSRLDPSRIDLAQFHRAFKNLTRNDPDPNFDQRIFYGLILLNNSSNPDPGQMFDGATREQWGWLQLGVSITCDCNGKITKVEHKASSNDGFIRTYSQSYAASQGDKNVSITRGGEGTSFVEVTAFHQNTLGGDARKAWTYLWREIENQAPSGWRRIEYELRCDKQYLISYSGSYFPSHQAYLDGKALGSRMQSGLGAFVFSGGVAPGGQFLYKGGKVSQ